MLSFLVIAVIICSHLAHTSPVTFSTVTPFWTLFQYHICRQTVLTESTFRPGTVLSSPNVRTVLNFPLQQSPNHPFNRFFKMVPSLENCTNVRYLSSPGFLSYLWSFFSLLFPDPSKQKGNLLKHFVWSDPHECKNSLSISELIQFRLHCKGWFH